MNVNVLSKWSAVLGPAMREIRRAHQTWPWWGYLGALACTIGMMLRLAAPQTLKQIDAVWARPGDSLTVLLTTGMAAAVAGAFMRRKQTASTVPQVPDLGSAMAPHFRLDEEIVLRLQEVITETETSSLAIIEQVRDLYDRAGNLVRYLEATNSQAGDMEREILASVTYLVQLSSFVQELPGKMQRDVQNIELIAAEIRSLGELAEKIQLVSMQSHILAINAAIEASRAGEAGRAFKVVAQEVRTLAADSSAAANEINAGLLRARSVLENGMEESVAESSARFDEIAHASRSLSNLQTSFKDITHYYRSRFCAVTQNNVDLAGSISEVLGQVQTQDVVRQRIERAQAAIVARNDALATHLSGDCISDKLTLQLALEIAFANYVATESMHASAAHSEEDSGLKIELF